MQPLYPGFHIVHQQAFGDFQLQLGGRQAGFLQGAPPRSDELVVQQLPHRDVDRNRRDPLFGVFGIDGEQAGFAQHPGADADDEVAFFGHGNELGRRDKAQFGAVPAQQRFKSVHFRPVGGQFVDRLKDQAQMLIRQGALETVNNSVTALHRLLHAVVIAEALLFAGAFGLVERQIGFSQQHVQHLAVFGVTGHAAAELEHERTAVRDDGLVGKTKRRQESGGIHLAVRQAD